MLRGPSRFSPVQGHRWHRRVGPRSGLRISFEIGPSEDTPTDPSSRGPLPLHPCFPRPCIPRLRPGSGTQSAFKHKSTCRSATSGSVCTRSRTGSTRQPDGTQSAASPGGSGDHPGAADGHQSCTNSTRHPAVAGSTEAVEPGRRSAPKRSRGGKWGRPVQARHDVSVW